MFSLYFHCRVSLICILTVHCQVGKADSKPTITRGNHESNGDVSLRIIGGDYAERGKYPFYASIQKRENRSHFCGGSLISDRHVLTAADCGYNLEPDKVAVAVGTIRIPGGDLYEIDKFTSHPDYDQSTKRADIAVIRLKKRVKLSEHVKIIHLPHPEPDYLGKYNRTMYLSGFGSQNKKFEFSPKLKKLTLTVNDCPDEVYYGGRICTSTIKDKEGTCYFDRGSPAIIYADLTIVMGIASQKSVTDGECAAGRPDVFTDVQYYEDWVRLQLE